MYHGDIRLGDTIDVKFTTVNTSGVPTTLAGTPVVSAYPDNSLTEITAGITLTVDFDARTGLHNVRVVATGANGYLTATNYELVITTGTVGGSSVVGYVVGSFSVEKRSALMPTTAARTLAVEADNMAHADLKEWLGVAPNALIAGRPDVDLGTSRTNSVIAGAIVTNGIDANILAASAVDKVVDQVWDELMSAHVASGSYGQRLQGVRSGTAQAGAAGSITLDSGASATTDYYKGSLVFLTSGTGSGQSQRLITAYNSTTKVATITPAWAVVPDATSVFIILPAGIASLEAWLGTVPLALVAQRVEARASAMTASLITATEAPNLDAAITTRLAPTVAGRTLDVAVGGEAGLDWANIGAPTTAQNLSGTNIDVDQVVASVSGAVASVTADVGITQAGADKVWLSASRTLTAFSTALALSVWDVLETAILTVGSLGKKLKDSITEARLAELDAANLPTDVAGVQADTDNIQTRLPAALVGGRMDSDVEAINNNTAVIARLVDSLGTLQRFTIDNGVFVATTTQAQVDAVTPGVLEATTDHYKGRIILFLDGALQYQATDITAYDGTNKRFTYTALTEAPADNGLFLVI